MADRYSMVHQNNNKEKKYSERSDNQRPGNRPGNWVDDPWVRAPDKEKVTVSGQHKVVAMYHEQKHGAVIDVMG